MHKAQARTDQPDRGRRASPRLRRWDRLAGDQRLKERAGETRAHVMRSFETWAKPHNCRSEPFRCVACCASPCSPAKPQFQLHEPVPPGTAEHRLIVRNCQILVQKSARSETHPNYRGVAQKWRRGVILPPPLGDSEAIVDLLVQAGVPAGSCVTAMPELGGLSVFNRHAAATADAPGISWSLGHRQIGIHQWKPKQLDSAQRYEGFHKS